MRLHSLCKRIHWKGGAYIMIPFLGEHSVRHYQQSRITTHTGRGTLVK